jgi:septal ring factor EnvC (AmiA/AmiB activator)
MILRLALLCLLAAPVAAQSLDDLQAAEAARIAATRLDAATRQLNAADSARDRVAALTETVRAFEDGLEALRDGLRRAALREARLTRELAAREAEIADLLGALQSMGRGAAPTAFLHPAGALGTARAGMILSDVAPSLNIRAAELRLRLDEVRILRALQESAAATLAKGLEGAQTARSDLSRAIADRQPLPRKFTEDPVRTAILIASTETLEGFASGLSEMARDETEVALPDITAEQGRLPLPVAGRLIRRAGEPDAAGVARPGVLLATRPNALITAPAAATIRYLGPLLDYGNVIILEPGPGILMVFAGLDLVYGANGEVVPAGAPLGLMGGTLTNPDAILPQDADGTGSGRPETLYIEIRVDQRPVDPAEWFGALKDG